MKKLIFSAKQIMKAVRAAFVALALTFVAGTATAGVTVSPTSGIWTSTSSGVYVGSGTTTSAYFDAATATGPYTVTVSSGSNLSNYSLSDSTTVIGNNVSIILFDNVTSPSTAINNGVINTYSVNVNQGVGFKNGSTGSVVNNGFISVVSTNQAYSVNFIGGTGDDAVTNTGSLFASGTSSATLSAGVSFTNTGNDVVTNSGLISANSSATAYGISFANTGTATVTNSGTIQATSSGTGDASGIFADGNKGVNVGTVSITNSGAVSGISQSGRGFGVQTQGTVGTTTVTNSGQISGQSVTSSAYSVSLYNNGGNTAATAGALLVYNSGSMAAVSQSGSATGVFFDGFSFTTFNLLNNTGSITASTGTGSAYGVRIVFGQQTVITNSGSITASTSPTSKGYGIFLNPAGSASAYNLAVTNTGTIYGSTSGIYSLAGSDTISLSGGSVTGGTSNSIYLTAVTSPVVSITGRTQLVTGAPFAIKQVGTTGQLNLNLVGGTPSQIAAAQTAALGQTGSFQFGSYTYSWQNFNVTQLQLFSFESVSLPQYSNLEYALDTRALPFAYDQYYAQIATSANENAAAISFLNALSGFTLIQGVSHLEVESQNTFQSTLEEQLETLGGVDGFSTANATIGDSSIASVNSANSQLDKLVAYAGSQMNGTETSKMMEPKTMAPVVEAQKWDVWLTGNVSLGRQDSLTGSPGYNSVDGTPMAGIDYAFTHDIKAGFLVGGTLDGANFSDGSRVNANTEIVGIFGTWNHGPWMADLVVAGGPSQYSDHRSTPTGTASSKPDGYSFMTQANTGYTFNLGSNFSATPEVGVQYTHLGVDGYTESGGGLFNTAVSSQDIDSFRTHLGGKVDGSFDMGPNLKWIPEVRAAWYHECLDDSRGVATSLTSAPAFGSFNVNTLTPERDYALLGVGLNSVFTGFQNMPIGMFLNYDCQVGQSSYIQHSITGGVKVSF